jgi:hypothetical protein
VIAGTPWFIAAAVVALLLGLGHIVRFDGRWVGVWVLILIGVARMWWAVLQELRRRAEERDR